MRNVSPRSKVLALRVVKWLAVVAACVFLFVRLTEFGHYSYLWSAFGSFGSRELWMLAGVLIMLPFNLFVEAFKWKFLISKTEKIKLSIAFRAVFAGFVTGFVTPNRVGELAGRMTGISDVNKPKIAVYSLINSVTQNIAIAAIGIPAFACFVFRYEVMQSDVWNYLWIIVLSCIVLVLMLFVAFRLLSGRYSGARWNLLADFQAPAISVYPVAVLLSVFRFCIFSFQFYLLLPVFGVGITFPQALLAIPSMYLLVTFTPAFAVTEVLVRTSYAILTVGVFTENTAGVFVTGFMLWIINFVVPMLLGGGVLLSKK